MITAICTVFVVSALLAGIKFLNLHPLLVDDPYLSWLPGLVDWMPIEVLGGIAVASGLPVAVAYARKK